MSRRWIPKRRRYLQNVSADHHLLLVLCLCQCQLTRWLPHLCSPLHGPRCSVSWFTSRGVGKSPSPKFAARQACYKAMHLSPPLVSTDLSAMASPTWSWILQTWRVEQQRATYGLYGVAANGLTVSVCMHVCIEVFVKVVELWVEVGQQSDSC